MQTINKKPIATAGVLLAVCATLLSFSSLPGADKFEIYLNNKLVLEHFVTQTTNVQYLTLHQSNYNDKIDIQYSHCGVSGKDRKIIIRDGQNKVLKTWQFDNAKGSENKMSWKVNEIMDLKKGKERASFKLYYSSRELPEGRLLATVVMGTSNYAKL
jgi:hypothetical protein